MPLRRFFSLIAVFLCVSFAYIAAPFSAIAAEAFPAPDPRAVLAAPLSEPEAANYGLSPAQVSSFTLRRLQRQPERVHGAPLNAGHAASGLRFVC